VELERGVVSDYRVVSQRGRDEIRIHRRRLWIGPTWDGGVDASPYSQDPARGDVLAEQRIAGVGAPAAGRMRGDELPVGEDRVSVEEVLGTHWLLLGANIMTIGTSFCA
jgi:hypothetical protein